MALSEEAWWAQHFITHCRYHDSFSHLAYSCPTFLRQLETGLSHTDRSRSPYTRAQAHMEELRFAVPENAQLETESISQ